MSGHCKRGLVALLVVVAVAACETPPPGQELPELTYGHLGKFRLNVGEVRVVFQYAPPMKPPNVEHLSSTPPEKALRRWAADRLLAEGTTGAARFVIIDAAVTETLLELEEGVSALFTTQQAVRYQAHAEAVLEILDARGYRTGYANARVSRTRTMAEDATLNERDRLWFELTEALLNDFNTEIEKNIRQFLGGHLF